jgi:hypothetical protein
MPHAHELISVPASEALCAVLLQLVLLGHAKTVQALKPLRHLAQP